MNSIGDTGATSLSEALKSNTTLTELDLSCDDKRKKTHKRYPSAIHSSILFISKGNNIGDTGLALLVEALKSNAALIELDLRGDNKNEDTQRTSINN